MPRTLTVLRYPGGKSQLYPFINNLLKINNINGTYIEPFAGGAGVAIKLLVENKVKNIWINDYDKSIYSIWNAIINKPNQLIKLINGVPFDLHGGNTSDIENLKYWDSIKSIHEKEKNYQNSIMNAFSTLMLNRLNTSGIINGGPIGGRSQKNTKIYVRFNKNTLIKKIHLINRYKDRIKLTRLDAFKMIPRISKELGSSKNSFTFFDPPYFKQGDNLYMSSFSGEKHKELSKLILNQKKEINWIVTYDDAEEIVNSYGSLKNKYRYMISYSANNKNRGKATELLFSNKNLKLESFDKTILKKF